MHKKFLTFSHFTLLIALSISAIAAYYSVIGLATIFAGAMIPIIVMGSILEIAKITTTVWLHKYWKKAGYAIKTYLTAAVIVLAMLTSMGIFGLLSKAHLEQNVVSGDVVSQISLFDEKIKTQRDNIELARKALTQMDAQVDQRLARGDTEAGAERAVQIRRQQATERSRLQKEIADAQKEITKLNEQRAPIASQLRKVEAEVGPIKYIAALIYGDNPDITTLERAVRWVIIMIVVVFDPLAIILILAANNSIKWEREELIKLEQTPVVENENQKELTSKNDDLMAMNIAPPKEEDTRKFTEEEINALDGKYVAPWPTEWETWSDENIEKVATETLEDIQKEEDKKQDFSVGSYSTNYTVSEPNIMIQSNNVNGDTTEESHNVNVDAKEESQQNDGIKTEGVTTKAQVYSTDEDYVIFDGKTISTTALKELHPNLVVNGPLPNEILFGNKFPAVAKTGDIYTRVDVIPHRTYKFNGVRWLQLDRKENTTYLQNIAYLQFLISKLDNGEYDPELLTEIEQDEISEYLKRSS